MAKTNYKIVLIHSIWEDLHTDVVKSYLQPLFQVKKDGYGSRHEDIYIPISKEDFIGNQLLVCIEQDKQLLPVCCSKVISSETCSRYKLEHPILTMLKNNFSDEYVNVVDKAIRKFAQENKATSYSGGFAIERQFIQTKEQAQEVKDIYSAVHLLLHHEFSLHAMFGFACPRVHTDKLFTQWGGEPIKYNGEIVMNKVSGLNFEEAICFKGEINRMQIHLQELIERYKDLWDSRIDSRHELRDIKKLKLAA